jgi:hypothetical protein
MHRLDFDRLDVLHALAPVVAVGLGAVQKPGGTPGVADTKALQTNADRSPTVRSFEFTPTRFGASMSRRVHTAFEAHLVQQPHRTILGTRPHLDGLEAVGVGVIESRRRGRVTSRKTGLAAGLPDRIRSFHPLRPDPLAA